MYHKDCLSVSPSRGHSLTQDMKIKNSRLFFFLLQKTWLNTPKISSCPMCRRDLALLAALTNMVPSKTVDEAVPYWYKVWIVESWSLFFFFFTFFSLPVEACWFTDIRDYIFVHKFTTVQLFQQITEYRSDYYLNAVATRLFFLVKRSNNRFCF